jgi:hypothetical protein
MRDESHWRWRPLVRLVEFQQDLFEMCLAAGFSIESLVSHRCFSSVKSLLPLPKAKDRIGTVIPSYSSIPPFCAWLIDLNQAIGLSAERRFG